MRKEERGQAKVDQKRNEDQAMVGKLCSLAELEPSEENVGKCELKHFAQLNSPFLKDFILARHPTLKKACDISHLKKPRGITLKDAEDGVTNPEAGVGQTVLPNSSVCPECFQRDFLSKPENESSKFLGGNGIAELESE